MEISKILTIDIIGVEVVRGVADGAKLGSGRTNLVLLLVNGG